MSFLAEPAVHIHDWYRIRSWRAASDAEALLELRAEASASGEGDEVTSFKIERREVSRAEVADAISGLRDRLAEVKRMLGAHDPS